MLLKSLQDSLLSFSPRRTMGPFPPFGVHVVQGLLEVQVLVAGM